MLPFPRLEVCPTYSRRLHATCLLLKIVFFNNLPGFGFLKSVFSGWFGWFDFCLSSEAWSCRCSFNGSTSVSSCRWWMLVSFVQPVAILSALFWTTWSFSRLVLQTVGDQMVFAFSSAGHIIVCMLWQGFIFVYPTQWRWELSSCLIHYLLCQWYFLML